MTRRTTPGAALLAALALVLLGLFAAAPAAAAAPPGPSGAAGQPPSELDKAVQALRSATLYLAPGATRTDAAVLRQALDGAGKVVVAVLSPAAAAQAGGDVDALPGQIAAGLNRAGTVVVLVGNRVALASVGADQVALGRALDQAQAALDRGPRTSAHVTAVLAQLVRAVRAAPSAFPITSEKPPARAGAPSAWTGYVGLLLALAAAGGAVAWLLRRTRVRRGRQPERLPRRRVHLDSAGRLISVEDVGPAAGGR